MASESPFPIELNVEHADLPRYPEETYLSKVVDLYRYKYSKQKMDLVLVMGDESMELLIEYGYVVGWCCTHFKAVKESQWRSLYYRSLQAVVWLSSKPVFPGKG